MTEPVLFTVSLPPTGGAYPRLAPRCRQGKDWIPSAVRPACIDLAGAAAVPSFHTGRRRQTKPHPLVEAKDKERHRGPPPLPPSAPGSTRLPVAAKIRPDAAPFSGKEALCLRSGLLCACFAVKDRSDPASSGSIDLGLLYTHPQRVFYFLVSCHELMPPAAVYFRQILCSAESSYPPC